MGEVLGATIAIVKKGRGVFTKFRNILLTARCMPSLRGLSCHQLSLNDHWKEEKRRSGSEVSRYIRRSGQSCHWGN
jgi:hypothetical protein